MSNLQVVKEGEKRSWGIVKQFKSFFLFLKTLIFMENYSEYKHFL